MRFAQDKEPIRWFRGYMFISGRPTEVTDKATIDILLRDPNFRSIQDEEVKGKESGKEGLLVSSSPRSRLSLPKKGKA
jgi:hypothetical protein